MLGLARVTRYYFKMLLLLILLEILIVRFIRVIDVLNYLLRGRLSDLSQA